MSDRIIYLDNNATTPLAPEVIEGMSTVLREQFGNPSSGHLIGQQAAYCVARSRRQVASALNAQPGEIVFTSGGTESDNLAIRGVLQANPDKRHVVITTVEHEAVARLMEHLAGEGWRTTLVNVGVDGSVDLGAFRAALADDTALCSVMLANNETGVLMPLDAIAAACHERRILLHTDAVQAMGKVPLDVRRWGADLLSLSAHKFHGPKGVGVLYVRSGVVLRPQIIGGHQESDRRAGTENVAGAAGLGIAAELAERGLPEMVQVRRRRDRLEQAVCAQIGEATVVAGSAARLPNTACIAFRGFSAERIVIGLSEASICVSAGAACHSGSLEPSRVLSAMGIPSDVALGAVRFSLSRYTTDADIEGAVEGVCRVVHSLRSNPEQAACPVAASRR